MKLYSFSQSSASWRVRIALALKGIDAQIIPIDLVNSQHLSDEYKSLNPQGRVPYFIDGDFALSQSLAILDYLEEKYGGVSIYPQSMENKALCRAFAHHIAVDIFPLQNLSTRRKLKNDFALNELGQAKWCAYFIERGFEGLENYLMQINANPQKGFMFAPWPTLAEICLVPQMRNARRYEADLKRFPLLCAYDEKASKHEAFVKTAPETQIG